jgi:hypothetical protein
MKGGRNRGMRDNQYVFSATREGKPVSDFGTSLNFGGLAGRVVLKPGDTFEDIVSLNKWFTFETPGKYEIKGSYYLNFVAQNTFSTIWEDHAIAQFSVTIGDKAPY